MVELGKLDLFSTTERMKLADKLRENHSEQAQVLYLSVAEHQPEDIRRPDAILAIYELTQKEDLLAVLAEEHPMHPATQVAKNKGWIK